MRGDGTLLWVEAERRCKRQRIVSFVEAVLRAEQVI
jgi:hypothetical protein